MLKPKTVSTAKAVVCYFRNWSAYRDGTDKYDVDKIDPQLCTHLVYSYAKLDPNKMTIVPSNPKYDTNAYGRFTALKKSNENLKTLIAVGGWTDSQKGDKYSRLVSSSKSRAAFITSVTNFLQTHGFDGLSKCFHCWDLYLLLTMSGPFVGNTKPKSSPIKIVKHCLWLGFDWEYPRSDADKAGLTALLSETKKAFLSRGLLLCAGVSGEPSLIHDGKQSPTKLLA